jgi:hypothetical protein
VKIISFAWTTPALVALEKTVTRRDWKDRFARQFKADELVAAYDKLARNHGRKVATIRLTCAPYEELVSTAPDSDYEAEGFGFFERHPEELPANAPWPTIDWGMWQDFRFGDLRKVMWVVRFEVVGVE